MPKPKSLIRFVTGSQIMKLYREHIIPNGPTQLAMLDSAVSSPLNHNTYGQDDIF